MKKHSFAGFSLIEMLVVIGLLAALFSLGGVVYNSFATQDRLTSETEKLVSAIGEMQAKTRAGFTQGGESALNFGLYFDSSGYTFFSGSFFSPSDPDNYRVELPQGLEFKTIAFPDQQLVFAKITGDLLGYQPGADYLVLADQNASRQRQIIINKIGTVFVQ